MGSDSPVLDSSAVLAALWVEPGHETVRSALEHAVRAGEPCAISAVNWGEVLYVAAKRGGQEVIPPIIEKIDGLPIVVVDADRDLTLRAAMIKASGTLDYADAFCAALAMTLGVPVLTAGSDFDGLAAEEMLEVRRIR